jgi:hypothetical protein
VLEEVFKDVPGMFEGITSPSSSSPNAANNFRKLCGGGY